VKLQAHPPSFLLQYASANIVFINNMQVVIEYRDSLYYKKARKKQKSDNTIHYRKAQQSQQLATSLHSPHSASFMQSLIHIRGLHTACKCNGCCCLLNAAIYAHNQSTQTLLLIYWSIIYQIAHKRILAAILLAANSRIHTKIRLN